MPTVENGKPGRTGRHTGDLVQFCPEPSHAAGHPPRMTRGQHEQWAHRGAWRGLGIGLAGGALVALFPGIGPGAGLLPGGTGGAGLGAMRREQVILTG